MLKIASSSSFWAGMASLPSDSVCTPAHNAMRNPPTSYLSRSEFSLEACVGLRVELFPAHLEAEPGPTVRPFVVRGGSGNAQRFGGLFIGASGKETQLD